VVRDGDGEPAIRVLAVVHCYPPAIGGVERAMRDILDGLVTDHGFDVTVLTTDAMSVDGFRDRRLPRITSSEATAGGALVRRFSVCSRVCRLLYRAQFVAWRFRVPGNDWLRTWGSGPISPGLRRAARRLDADVIFVASFPLNHVFYALGRRDAVPVVVMPAAHPADRWGYERPNLLRATRGAFATVALSSHEADWLADRGIARERVKLIPLGLDPSALRPEPGAFRRTAGLREDDFVVAFIGQHAPHKGLDTLVAMFPALVARVAEARLVIAGAETPWSEELRRRVERLPPDVRGRVTVRGAVTEQEKADILGDCDVFVSPSRAESFGLTTLEAWALERPVVLGDTPSQHDVAGSEGAAVFVDPEDPGELARTLGALCADPTRRAAIGRAGRLRLLERFTRQHMVLQWADLLREAAAAGPSRRGT
jgi:glycosyltransferase involved in cell wall biosynthesis